MKYKFSVIHVIIRDRTVDDLFFLFYIGTLGKNSFYMS